MAVVMGRGHGVWRGGVWPRRVVMRQGVQRGRVVGCRLRRGHRGASCDAVAPTVVGVWREAMCSDGVPRRVVMLCGWENPRRVVELLRR